MPKSVSISIHSPACITRRALLPLMLLAWCGFFSPGLAQEQSVVEQVDAFVKLAMERQRIPGLSLAVVKDGKIVLAKGYGLANVELNVAATPETVYEIGSVTKQFTATAVMMLVEEGTRCSRTMAVSLAFDASWFGIPRIG